MTTVLVLDSESVSSLANENSRHFNDVRAEMEAARRLGRDVIVPAVILAELYRGPKHNQILDSLLSRESALVIRNTDRELAKYVGGVLHSAAVGSEYLADAHVVACVVEEGKGVVLTGDKNDMKLLSSSYPNIQITTL